MQDRLKAYPTFALSLACLFAATARAEEEAVVAANDYMLRTWEVDDGLPDNTVTAITQTRDGYLWIGTVRGLARFDGVRFSVFTAANTPALTASDIRCLSEDNNGALWIGLDRNRVARFDRGKFAPVAPPAETAQITSLVADADGGIWAGFAEARAQRWRAGKWNALGAADGLTGKGGVRFVSSAAGKIWFTTDASYGFLDGQRFNVRAAQSPQVAPRHAGGYWLAAGEQLQLFIGAGEPVLTAKPPWRGGSGEIHVLHADRQGALWIGTKGQGLFRFADGVFARVPTSHNFITAIAEDREGNLWAGTLGGGLNCLRPRVLQVHDERSGMPTDLVYSICQDGEGALWFGAHTDGAVRLQRGRYTFFSTGSGWPGGVLTTLCPDGAGGVWFGTLLQGLHHWERGAFTTTGLKGEQITSLFQDRQGALWIGLMNGGLLQLRDSNIAGFPLENGGDEVTAMTQDSAGTLWVGTHAGTLHRLTGEEFSRHGGDALAGDSIQTIFADGAESLWIGTRGGGLVRFRQGEISRITTRHGLPNDDIRQILADDNGNLWIGSLRGLFRAARRDLEEVAAGRRATVECVAYGRSEGLGSFEFAEGYANAACRTRDGHLWFATRRGAVEINPKELLVTSQPLPVRVEELVVDDKPQPVPASGRIEIPPLPRKIELRYTALTFAAPEKVRFRYRLDDVDKNWTDAAGERVATFLRMPPGNYRFRVTASNGDGAWTANGAVIEFVVQPALWQTIWFRIAAALALVVVAGVIVRFILLRRLRNRLRALEREHALEAERARIAKDMHDDLGARLTRIALLSEAARNDANLSAEATVRAEKISRAAREVSQTLDEIVWTVNPGNDTLERLVGYLGEYTAEYLAATGIQFEQDLPESVPAVPISSETRHNLLLAVKEALNNAVKYAAAKKISLSVTLDGSQLRVQVADDGQGFSLDSPRATGHGLTNMKQRLAAAAGDCRIESAPGKGTRVTLNLPLRTESRTTNNE